MTKSDDSMTTLTCKMGIRIGTIADEVIGIEELSKIFVYLKEMIRVYK